MGRGEIAGLPPTATTGTQDVVFPVSLCCLWHLSSGWANRKPELLIEPRKWQTQKVAPKSRNIEVSGVFSGRQEVSGDFQWNPAEERPPPLGPRTPWFRKAPATFGIKRGESSGSPVFKC